MAMTDVHRTTLRRSRVFLLENLDIENIIHPLVAEDILKAADEDALSAHTVKRDKIKYLLDLLPRKGVIGYTGLMKVLKEDQTFVYQKLCETEREILQSGMLQQQGPARNLQPCYVTPGLTSFQPPFAKQESLQPKGIVAQPSSLSPMAPRSDKFSHQETQEPMSKDEADAAGSTLPRSPSLIVSDKALGTLASNLGSEWEQLAIHMGFPQNKLYHWKQENQYSVWGQVFSMLTCWKQQSAHGATISNLLSVLQSLEPPLDQSAYTHLYHE